MLYQIYEMTHASVAPMRRMAEIGHYAATHPTNPLNETPAMRYFGANMEMFVNATKRYGKPEFGIDSVKIDGKAVKVGEKIVDRKPFCNLLHFTRKTDRKDPPVLIIAPLSGHYATLLRGTVRQMLKSSDVYITDWIDARTVPITEGKFDLDDYVDYIRSHMQILLKRHGVRPHVLAVCQPGVPAMVAAALMAEDNDPARPATMTLMGSPIDVAINPKGPNELANSQPLSWFKKNVIMTVPFPNAGMMRNVYPGFLQLQGFMTMNLDRHVDAHLQHFRHMITGDGESAEAHREFYDEYLAVMDMTEEFYLQTIDRVFQRRLLSEGEYYYRDRLVDPSKISDIGLITIEGQRDDITGVGQTAAAHKLIPGVPENMRMDIVQQGVGHYGIFNGSRWRNEIYPQIRDFIIANEA